MVRYLGNMSKASKASKASNMGDASSNNASIIAAAQAAGSSSAATNPHWRADRADFPASQNSHCCYSAAFSIMERDVQALDRGLLAQIDVSKVELRVAAARLHLAEPDDAMLDAEYAAARANSRWPERMYWLRSNWRWLASEAAIYAGALAVLSMPVWAGAAGKALLAAVGTIDLAAVAADLSANLAAIGARAISLLDSMVL